MKSFLDDPKTYSLYDQNNVYQSLINFPAQFESGWHDSQFVNLGFDPINIHNIIFVGMGGSNLPAYVLQSLSPYLFKIPFEIVSNYRLPQYANKKTLIVLVSYSGNTEEVISCAQDAYQRNSPTLTITTGGKLRETAINHHWPIILLDEKLNLSSVPRYGLGLLLGASLGLMVRLNPEAYHFVDPKEILRTVERSIAHLNQDQNSENNPAKIFALKNRGQALAIIAANHLSGSAKIGANFLNETAKTFSTNFFIPDINHHLLEGLAFPLSLKDNTRFILLNSSLYPEVIQKRFQITKEIILKQQYQLTVISPETNDPVSQAFESLVFLTLFSYYLCIVNKQDPSSNPWVDFFKNKLI